VLETHSSPAFSDGAGQQCQCSPVAHHLPLSSSSFTMSSKATSVVARIAFFASDIVVDSGPASRQESTFSPLYHTLSQSAKWAPTILSLPHGADPGSTLSRRAGNRLLSYTTVATTPVLARLIPHLHNLASYPVVLHLAVNGDLAPALLLRSSVPFFIYSDSPQQAHDHALLASRLAKSENKLVVHAFRAGHAGNNAEEVEEVLEESIQLFLRSDKVDVNGSANGHANGHTNGSANGYANGDVNGHSNGSNGHANGHANGHHEAEKGASAQLLKAFDAAAVATLKFVRRAQPAYRFSGDTDSETTFVVLGQSFLY
jgi:sulfite reductase (NADPH) hemoprotein beta-component